jgi:hypothetical protein
MKKLKMDLNGIGELLSKEQMKMVTGGNDYDFATYIQCNWLVTYDDSVSHYDNYGLVRGNWNQQIPYGNCQIWCANNQVTSESGAYYSNHNLQWCGYY